MDEITHDQGPGELNTSELLSRLVLTVSEVAALLRVSDETVRNLHRVGQLRGVLIGKHLRWRPKDVRAFVESLRTD